MYSFAWTHIMLKVGDKCIDIDGVFPKEKVPIVINGNKIELGVIKKTVVRNMVNDVHLWNSMFRRVHIPEITTTLQEELYKIPLFSGASLYKS